MQTMIALEVGTISFVPLRYVLDGNDVHEIFIDGSNSYKADERIHGENMLGSRYHWGL